MHANDLIEIVCATHLSSYVESPYAERGGLFLVGPPGALKTTFTDVLDQQYNDAVTVSDLNVQGLVQMRDAIAGGAIRTLVLPELAKVYERHQSTASNVEGTLRALVGEGFQNASFEDQRVNRLRARAVVVGALTPAMQTRRFTEWEESGFNRRFLWALIRLKDPTMLERATVEWRRVNFQMTHVPRPPEGGHIPNTVTATEREELRRMVKHQPGGSRVLQLQLLSKIYAVLKWWYAALGNTREAIDTIRRFAPSLARDGTDVEITDTPVKRSDVPHVAVADGWGKRRASLSRVKIDGTRIAGELRAAGRKIAARNGAGAGKTRKNVRKKHGAKRGRK